MSTKKPLYDEVGERHFLPNPFPYPFKTLRPGADELLVVDEMCGCGHKRSDHFDRFAYGHGKCGCDNCSCRQFTWVNRVYSTSTDQDTP